MIQKQDLNQKIAETKETVSAIVEALANICVQGALYPWNAEFTKDQLRESIDRIKSASNFQYIDPHALRWCSVHLGEWDGEIVLLPIWILPFLDPDAGVFCIDGSMCRVHQCDNDNRCGYIAYGILR